MSRPVVLVEQVCKSFRRGDRVLDGVNLRIEEGEMVALIGPSGSGKSTLIRLICGLDSIDAVHASRISLFGHATQVARGRTREARRLRRDVSVIFQQFNLVPRLSLLTNVLAGRLGRVAAWRGLLALFPRADRIKALRALERVGIAGLSRQRASTLSGGQQQRGAIARALAQEAKLILADEPIASLDPASAEQVMGILASINRDDRVTVVVCLHQIDHALKHCSRVVALKDGSIVYDGPTREFGADRVASLYGVAGGELDPGVPAASTTRATGHRHRRTVNAETARAASLAAIIDS